jgi:membrane-bound ClpP family serine protease
MIAFGWIAALVAVGLGMLVLEVFVPSGGVLGFLSVVALGAGVVTAFAEHGPAVGVVVLAATAVAAPVVLGLAFRMFPDTPLGRRVLPPPPQPDEVVPDVDRRKELREFVGREGRALIDLLPWGAVEVGGRELSAMSESGPITAGTTIEVLGVQAGGLVVRPAVLRPAPQSSDTSLPLRPSASVPPGADEPVPRRLEEALEAFDFGALAGDGGAAEPGKLDSPTPPNQS